MKSKNHIKISKPLRGVGKLGYTESGKVHGTLRRMEAAVFQEMDIKTVPMQHTNGQIFDVPVGYRSLNDYLSVVKLNLDILNKMIERGEGSPTAPQTAAMYAQILERSK